MPIALTDAQIAKLLAEKRYLTEGFQRRLKLKAKRGHSEAELIVVGEAESDFRLILRKSTFNPFDFSVILSVRLEGSNRLFRLIRYNGKSHEHTNKLEEETFYDFHVHRATERYQAEGMKEDFFAETTDAYATFEQALDKMIIDHFEPLTESVTIDDSQMILFDSGEE